MIAETCVQGGLLILALYVILRLFPSIPPAAQCWLWRLAFIKLALGLLSIGVVSLHVLPAEPMATATTSELTATPDVAPLLWAAAYGLGLLGIAARLLWGITTVRRIVSQSESVTDERLNQILDLLLLRAGVHRRPRLLWSTQATTPLLVGGVRAAIVLPSSARSSCTTEELGLMIAHEVAHIARKDLLWNLFQTLVHAPLYFHPLVWLAARCSHLARESAADQLALRVTGSKPKAYGAMLLRAAVVGHPMHAEPAGVAMVGSYRTVQRRLKTMQQFTKRPSAMRNVFTGALLLATVGFLPTYQLVAEAQEPAQALPPAPVRVQAAPTAASPGLPMPPAAAPTPSGVARQRGTAVAPVSARRNQSRRRTTRSVPGTPVAIAAPPVRTTLPVPGEPPRSVAPAAALPGAPASPPIARTTVPGMPTRQELPTPAAQPPSQTRGVPYLKDLPIIGRLFRIEPTSVEPVVASAPPQAGSTTQPARVVVASARQAQTATTQVRSLPGNARVATTVRAIPLRGAIAPARTTVTAQLPISTPRSVEPALATTRTTATQGRKTKSSRNVPATTVRSKGG
jgi:beta-lactamase regulating signal transducer with metallopeptidase domain